MGNPKQLSIAYVDYDSPDDLTQIHQDLLHKAKAMSAQAYAPYSNFPVGSAVLLDNGQEVGGNNQENRAFPAGLCAERVALFSAAANYPQEHILAIAIYVNQQDQISPCGSCRQVLLEYEERQKKQIEVFLMNGRGEVRYFEGISALLPFAFTFDQFQTKQGKE